MQECRFNNQPKLDFISCADRDGFRKSSHIFITTEDDLSNIYTVEEAVYEIGFGVFQVLLSFFCGVIWVEPCDLENTP